jgi:GMP synthase (glutamine-hydrolysing)
MPRLLVCQHVPYEILGTLDPLLRGSGFRIRYVNFGRTPEALPTIDGYQGLIILGGPMNVGEEDRYPHLRTEKALVREAVEEGVPVLGICLGAQLIAAALGAEVRPATETEIGWYDVAPTMAAREDPVLAHFAASERLFQWHGDTFELPDGAVHLAAGDTVPNQAFRWGDNVYGLQFHLEVDEPTIERWLQVPLHREQIARLGGKIDPEEIRRATPRHIGRLKELSDRTFGAFATLLGRPRKHRILPSR